MCGDPSLHTGNMLDLAIFVLTLHIMHFFLSLRLWNVLEDYVPFSRFGTQRVLLSGAVVSALTPLEFS